MLDERLVPRPSDLDAATVLGIGFPDYRGGVLRYAHDNGVMRIAARLTELAQQVGERYAPSRAMLEHKGAE